MIQEISVNTRAMRYTPDNFNGKLPCIIEFNGMSENANDGDISLVYRHGPMHFLKDGAWKPTNFILVNAFPPMDFPKPDFIDAVINAVLQTQAADPKRIYLSGLSAGAQSIMEYVMEKPEYAKKVAALIIMSVTNEPCNIYFNNDAAPVHNPDAAKNLLHVPVHFFHGDQDVVPHNIEPVRKVFNDLRASGNTQAFMTELAGVGHGGWETICDPNYKGANGGTDIYTWLLKYGLATPVVPPPPPVPKLVNTISIQVFSDGTTKVTNTNASPATKAMKSVPSDQENKFVNIIASSFYNTLREQIPTAFDSEENSKKLVNICFLAAENTFKNITTPSNIKAEVSNPNTTTMEQKNAPFQSNLPSPLLTLLYDALRRDFYAAKQSDSFNEAAFGEAYKQLCEAVKPFVSTPTRSQYTDQERATNEQKAKSDLNIQSNNNNY